MRPSSDAQGGTAGEHPAINATETVAGNPVPVIGYTVAYALANVVLPLLGLIFVVLARTYFLKSSYDIVSEHWFQDKVKNDVCQDFCRIAGRYPALLNTRVWKHTNLPRSGRTRIPSDGLPPKIAGSLKWWDENLRGLSIRLMSQLTTSEIIWRHASRPLPNGRTRQAMHLLPST